MVSFFTTYKSDLNNEILYCTIYVDDDGEIKTLSTKQNMCILFE